MNRIVIAVLCLLFAADAYGTTIDRPGGGSGGGHIIEEEGTPLAQEPALNFIGAGVTCAPGSGKTECTVPGFTPDNDPAVDHPGYSPFVPNANPAIDHAGYVAPDATHLAGDGDPNVGGETCINVGSDRYIDLLTGMQWYCSGIDEWRRASPTIFNVLAYGAVADATLATGTCGLDNFQPCDNPDTTYTDNTQPFLDAIAAANASPTDAIVFIPCGLYRFGSDATGQGHTNEVQFTQTNRTKNLRITGAGECTRLLPANPEGTHIMAICSGGANCNVPNPVASRNITVENLVFHDDDTEKHGNSNYVVVEADGNVSGGTPERGDAVSWPGNTGWVVDWNAAADSGGGEVRIRPTTGVAVDDPQTGEAITATTAGWSISSVTVPLIVKVEESHGLLIAGRADNIRVRNVGCVGIGDECIDAGGRNMEFTVADVGANTINVTAGFEPWEGPFRLNTFKLGVSPGTFPAGLDGDTDYYIGVDNAADTTATLHLKPGGPAVDITDTGTSPFAIAFHISRYTVDGVLCNNSPAIPSGGSCVSAAGIRQGTIQRLKMIGGAEYANGEGASELGTNSAVDIDSIQAPVIDLVISDVQVSSPELNGGLFFTATLGSGGIHNVVVKNSTFDVRQGKSFGLLVGGDDVVDQLTVTDSTFYAGVSIGATNALLQNNTFIGNGTETNYAMEIGDDGFRLIGNRLTGYGQGALRISGGSNVLVDGNVFETNLSAVDNNQNVIVVFGGSCPVTGLRITNNRLLPVGFADGGIFVNASNCADIHAEGNTIVLPDTDGNGVGIGRVAFVRNNDVTMGDSTSYAGIYFGNAFTPAGAAIGNRVRMQGTAGSGIQLNNAEDILVQSNFVEMSDATDAAIHEIGTADYNLVTQNFSVAPGGGATGGAITCIGANSTCTLNSVRVP